MRPSEFRKIITFLFPEGLITGAMIDNFREEVTAAERRRKEREREEREERLRQRLDKERRTGTGRAGIAATEERVRKEQERNAQWMAEHAQEWAEKKAEQQPAVDALFLNSLVLPEHYMMPIGAPRKYFTTPRVSLRTYEK